MFYAIRMTHAMARLGYRYRLVVDHYGRDKLAEFVGQQQAAGATPTECAETLCQFYRIGVDL